MNLRVNAANIQHYDQKDPKYKLNLEVEETTAGWPSS